MTIRLVVMASGNGSNFQALVDASRDGRLDAEVVALVCNRTDAFVVERAATEGVPTSVIGPSTRESRADFDARLAATVALATPDFIVLAGWMRMLSMAFLGCFPGRVVNLHPALPGEFPGTHAIERALAAGVGRTGVMVHYVPDEGMDDGPLIATAEVQILPDDTVDSLSARVHACERTLLVTALQTLATTRNP